MYGCVYKIINIQNHKVYIGQTFKYDPIKYIKSHFQKALKNNDNNKYLYRAIRKYGIQNFKWEILGYCETKKELDEAEIECIHFYRSYGSNGIDFDKIYGYNMTLGGDGCKGYKHTDEQRQQTKKRRKEEFRTGKRFISTLQKQQISEANAGNKNGMYGKNAFENKTEEEMLEIKRKISNKLKGKSKKSFTKEHINNLSIANKGKNKGKKRSDVYKKNLSKIKTIPLPIEEIINQYYELQKIFYLYEICGILSKKYDCSAHTIERRIKKYMDEN